MTRYEKLTEIIEDLTVLKYNEKFNEKRIHIYKEYQRLIERLTEYRDSLSILEAEKEF